jgi:hypothetical protein
MRYSKLRNIVLPKNLDESRVKKAIDWWRNRWDEPCDNPSCQDEGVFNWFNSEMKGFVDRYNLLPECRDDLDLWYRMYAMYLWRRRWIESGRKPDYFEKYLS